MEASLLKGNGLADMLAALGYSDAVMTQINLADKHGNIKLTLEKIQDYLSQFRQIKRKTIDAVTYPIILLGFFSGYHARLAALPNPSARESKCLD